MTVVRPARKNMVAVYGPAENLVENTLDSRSDRSTGLLAIFVARAVPVAATQAFAAAHAVRRPIGAR